MNTLELSDSTINPSLLEHVQNLGQEPLILTSHGQPVAALVPIENADIESISLSTNPQFLALIERSRARHKAEGGVSPDEMRRTLGLES